MSSFSVPPAPEGGGTTATAAFVGLSSQPGEINRALAAIKARVEGRIPLERGATERARIERRKKGPGGPEGKDTHFQLEGALAVGLEDVALHLLAVDQGLYLAVEKVAETPAADDLGVTICVERSLARKWSKRRPPPPHRSTRIRFRSCVLR